MDIDAHLHLLCMSVRLYMFRCSNIDVDRYRLSIFLLLNVIIHAITRTHPHVPTAIVLRAHTDCVRSGL